MQMNAILASAILGFGMVTIVDGAPVSGDNVPADERPVIISSNTTQSFTRKYVQHFTTKTMTPTQVMDTDLPRITITQKDPRYPPGFPFWSMHFPGPSTTTDVREPILTTITTDTVSLEGRPMRTSTSVREPILTTITTDTFTLPGRPMSTSSLDLDLTTIDLIITTVTVDPPAPTTMVTKSGLIETKPIEDDA
ncbi:hypothetical protein CPLU01_12757 [Colletotrichum plurivorum]|uniref:Uncharacterized protein n=1 Tax=Colletotrichum plurivorum TaxID=2175906 RepID=A0A8H6JXB1_9PEZI|nr:hypothetical protein CPLU01_12757 [Colletotrichum plurivorum]